MNNQEFVFWLKGFTDAVGEEGPTLKQWDVLKDKLIEVKDGKTPSFPFGTPNTTPNTHPFPLWQEPYINPFKGGTGGKVRYGDICPCNPNNGGSGICGCIMGNEWVDAPQKSTISHSGSINIPNGTSITIVTGSSGIYTYNPSTSTAYGYPSGSAWHFTNTMFDGTLHSTPESEEYIKQQNDKNNSKELLTD